MKIVEYLMRLSEGKLYLVKQLLALTEEQNSSLREGKSEVLEDLIEKKQKIMERVDVLDKEFVEKYDMVKEKLLPVQVENRDEIVEQMRFLQEKIKEIYIITEKIQYLDNQNIELLKRSMQQVKNQLKTVNIGKKAIKGYSVSGTEGISIFVDKKR